MNPETDPRLAQLLADARTLSDRLHHLQIGLWQQVAETMAIAEHKRGSRR